MSTTAGITIDRTPSGSPLYAHIDLRKYSHELTPFFLEKGIELEPTIKWTKKMKRALKETEFKKGNINNFWDE